MDSSGGDYEVFLSFRGADTRQGFTDVLYDYMDNADIRVFRDDNALRIGDKIDSILEFIVNSKICIPIFSPKFVQSKYCMLEVTKMVELKKTIVPIFYNVTSDDVKLKTPLYVNDLQMLEEKYGNYEVDKWKEALKIAVSYKGRKVGVKGYSRFCKEFVAEVLSKLRSRDLESSSSSHQEVVSAGIDGMPGGSVATVRRGPVTVLGQEFVAPYPIKLIIQKTVLNPIVRDSNGTVIFSLKEEYSRSSSSFKLLDAFRKTLATIKHEVLVDDVHAYRGKSTHNNKFLFKIKFPKGQYDFSTKSKFNHYVYMAQNTNEDVWDYMIEGYWSDKTCVIYAGNNDIVAQIMPKEGIVFTGLVVKDYLLVTVYPHIDYAFIVALLVGSLRATIF